MNKDSVNKAKAVAEKIWKYVKIYSEKALKISKIVLLKTAEVIGRFYKYKVIPFAKNLKKRWNEFSRSAKPEIKKDFEKLLGNLKDTFSGLAHYGKLAFSKAVAGTKNLYSLIRLKLSKGKSPVPVSVPIKRPVVPASGFFGNLIRNIKYLSYRKLAIYCLAFILFDVFLLWFSSYRVLYAKHYWEGTEDKKYFIRPGKSLDEVIGELKQNDILKSKFLFKVYVKLSGKEDKIISKRYIFKSGISNSELLNLLTDKNMVQMEKFTLIEGLRIKQIAKISENKLQLSAERFIKETENDSLIGILGLNGKIKNLEGFLFPDTYYLPLDVDEKGLVNILFNEFRKRVLEDSTIKAGLSGKNKNILEVITLASIVQGETNLKDEMPVVSGVYHNRLRKNMKLEADPTVQYIIPDGPKPRLKYSDLKTESPYNTYLHFGLPPGPINNPGIYAIKASLYPDKNNYLFFVATGNGGHRFTENYSEHLKAVEDYKRNLEKKNE